MPLYFKRPEIYFDRYISGHHPRVCRQGMRDSLGPAAVNSRGVEASTSTPFGRFNVDGILPFRCGHVSHVHGTLIA